MEQMEEAIAVAQEAVAVAARAVAVVEGTVKTLLEDAVPEEARQHLWGTSLALSEADGALQELRESLIGAAAHAKAAR